MKPAIHLHPDFVRVCTNGAQYLGSREAFAQHWGEEPPACPDGIDEIIYEPGIRHAYIKDNSVVDGGPMPWPEGDRLFEHMEAALQVVHDEMQAREQQHAAERQAEKDYHQAIIDERKTENARQEEAGQRLKAERQAEAEQRQREHDEKRAALQQRDAGHQQRENDGRAKAEKEKRDREQAAIEHGHPPKPPQA